MAVKQVFDKNVPRKVREHQKDTYKTGLSEQFGMLHNEKPSSLSVFRTVKFDGLGWQNFGGETPWKAEEEVG
jgi:hypothetical protein